MAHMGQKRLGEEVMSLPWGMVGLGRLRAIQGGFAAAAAATDLTLPGRPLQEPALTLGLDGAVEA